MKKSVLLIATTLFFRAGIAQAALTIPPYYQVDEKLSAELRKIVSDLELDRDFDVGEDGKERISFAVIDLTGKQPRLGGVGYDNFIYPASVYKMYVGAEILRQVAQGKRSLYEPTVAKIPNVVDTAKEIESDPRPLLKDGDKVTINYLLDLMITRSDNSAANCLIDIAQRKNIDELLHSYGWFGSEVTRKFLKRKFEDPGYDTARGTETCALHAAEFMYRVYTNQLVNPWVSMQMKSFLGRQLDTSKIAAGLPRDVMFYHKTGWFSYWTNDVGIVEGAAHYVIACFVPLTEEVALPKLRELSRRVYEMMLQAGAGRGY